MENRFYHIVRATGKVRPRENNPLRFGFELEIIEGPKSGDNRWYNADFTEGWAENTIKALKILGWDGTDDGTWPGLGSTRAEAVEVEREYPPGTMRLDIKYINAPRPPKAKGTGVLGPKYKSLIKSVQVDIDPSAKIVAETEESPF